MLKPAVVVACLFLTLIPAEATVWHVYEDGSGDAPSIRLAFQMASAGDTILVGPGIYYEGDVLAKPHVYLHSEMGPAHTLIDAGATEYGLFSIDEHAPAEIIGFAFTNAMRTAVSLLGGGAVTVKDCLIYDNSVGFYAREFYGLVENVTVTGGFYTQWSGSGFSFWGSPDCIVRECISAFNEGYGVVSWMGSVPDFECCDVFENGDGNYDGPDQTGLRGNISADPLFCDPENNDYHLSPGSPCLPNASSPTCTRMGALGWQVCPTGEGTQPLTGKPGEVILITWMPASGDDASRVLLRLDEQQPVRLDVWDVTGRRVRGLDLGVLGSGQRTWTAESLLPGGSVISGIYFVQFRGRDWSKSLKLPIVH